MTSTKEMLGPRKNGPVTWEALTRAVMADWRVDVRTDCLLGQVAVRRKSKDGMIFRLIWGKIDVSTVTWQSTDAQ